MSSILPPSQPPPEGARVRPRPAPASKHPTAVSRQAAATGAAAAAPPSKGPLAELSTNSLQERAVAEPRPLAAKLAQPAAGVGGVGGRAVSARLAAAAVAHPLARSSTARAVEVALAPVAASDPRAQRAVAATLTTLVRFLDTEDFEHAPLGDLLGAWLGAGEQKRPRFSQTGDVHPSHVEEVVAHGNLREQLNLLSNSQPAMSQALYRAGIRAGHDEDFAARLADLGLDVPRIVARAAELRPENAGAFLNAEGPIAATRQGAMRRARLTAVDEATNGVTNRRSDHAFTPPLSPRELAHLNTWAVTSGTPEEQAAVARNESFRLPQADGKQLFAAKRSDGWHAQSAGRGMHTAVSISGTAYRLMRMARLLDPHGPIEHFRTGLLGHMVPYHHTYHEVMSAAADLGMAYTPTPDAMIAHARDLAGEVAKLAPAPATEWAVAHLVGVLDEARAFEAAKR